MNSFKPQNKLLLHFERFFFIYLAFYVLAMQMTPWSIITEPFIFKPITKSFASLFGIDFTNFSNGSGDTTYDYFKTLLLLTLSIITFIIVFIRSKSLDNLKLRKWGITTLRYFLSFFLLIYGLSKVYPLQFGLDNSLYDLSKTYGDSSPMKLLWTFMGHSRPYTIFTGLAEVFAGLLLINRKTILLGALTAFGVMLNVFLLNIFYDVPVKLFSGHLLVFSIAIISMYLEPLYSFFIKNENNAPITNIGFDFSPKARQTINTLKLVFISIVILLIIASFLGLGNLIGNKKKDPLEFKGVHRIISFKRNNILVSDEDDTKWGKLIFDHKSGFTIENNNGDRQYHNSIFNLDENTILNETENVLKYNLQKDTFHLNGVWRKDTLNIIAILKKPEDFLLNSRGFHWVNELPFNK